MNTIQDYMAVVVITCAIIATILAVVGKKDPTAWMWPINAGLWAWLYLIK